MSKIDTTGWKEFRIGDLFDVHPTKAYKLNNADLFAKEGDVPVLSNSSFNNGISGRCGLEPLEDGGIITFSDTTTGADTMFYQDSPFIGYPHVQGMYPIGFELNEQVAMFLISVMRASFSKDFDYANKFNRTIVMNTTILLPVRESEEIDYEYMEERIRELEEERIRELDAYLKMEKLRDANLTKEEESSLKNHRKFILQQFYFGVNKQHKGLFTLKGIKQAKTQKEIPDDPNGVLYVIQSLSNNMISRTVDRRWLIEHGEAPVAGNAIVLGVTTPAVSYQAYEFGASQVISARADFLNENRGLYFVSLMSKRMALFSYTQKPGIGIYQDMLFDLPVLLDKDGQPVLDPECKYHDEGYIPDFDFMDRYITAQKKLAIQSVNAWRKKEIDIATMLVNVDNDRQVEEK